MFVLQSKYDHFQLNAELGLDCMNPNEGGQPYSPPWRSTSTCTSADKAAISRYGDEFWSYFAATASRARSRRGVFLSSCIIHGQIASAAWNHTLVDGATPTTAFAAWTMHACAGKRERTSKIALLSATVLCAVRSTRSSSKQIYICASI